VTQETDHRAATWIPGALIIGACLLGLAAAACLTARGVPTTVLEMSDSLTSTWCHRTYERLTLHLPRHFCELPLLPFPKDYPTARGPSMAGSDLGLVGSDLGSFFILTK
jgi:indole-3-pyruvate monooxygenase